MPCYIAQQTPACTIDGLTSSPGIFYETLMHHATSSGSPHNALHSPSTIMPVFLNYINDLKFVIIFISADSPAHSS